MKLKYRQNKFMIIKMRIMPNLEEYYLEVDRGSFLKGKNILILSYVMYCMAVITQQSKYFVLILNEQNKVSSDNKKNIFTTYHLINI